MSIKNNRWSGIHSLDQVTRIHIHEELSFTESVITLSSSIENLPFVTNFASCGNGEFIFVFSGFTYPKYKATKENLHKFQPPKANRNKLPKLSSDLFKIDLLKQEITSCSSLSEIGAYNGTALILSDVGSEPELVIQADPRILLYSERILDPPKCELPAEFGACSLPITEKKKNSYYCTQPTCNKKIHLKCDKSLKGKTLEHQFCPSCRNLNPATWKPLPGARRPRFRSRK